MDREEYETDGGGKELWHEDTEEAKRIEAENLKLNESFVNLRTLLLSNTFKV